MSGSIPTSVTSVKRACDVHIAARRLANSVRKRYSVFAYGRNLIITIYGDRRPMAGRQIVALKMRVRFPSTTPAPSGRARFRVSLLMEREYPPHTKKILNTTYTSMGKYA